MPPRSGIQNWRKLPKPAKIDRSRTADSLRTHPAKAVRIAFTRIYSLQLTLNCIVIHLSLAHKPVLLWAVARGVFS